MLLDNFDEVDPKAFFEEHMRAHRSEKRKGLTYAEWARSCARVLATEAGQRMIHGAQVVCGYYGERFSEADDYNTHAAAKRDGACGLISRIQSASEWDEHHNQTPFDDEN